MANLKEFKKVLILQGGISDEHDVSMKTGNEVFKALEKKYNVRKFTVTFNINKLLSEIEDFKPDIIFNALHGLFGEDGQIQSILNLVKVPYTHSGVSSSSIGMNKLLSKYIFQNIGINCPQGEKIKVSDINKTNMTLPLIIKPINGGSSIGIQKLSDMKPKTLKKIEDAIGKNTEVLIEKFISGRELTVGILNNKICGITEIIPKIDFYDYENKYINIATHIQNPKIPKIITDLISTSSLLAHTTLNCNCISRCDFRYDELNETVYLLEINTQPGLTENSLVPEMVKQQGTTFQELCEILIQNSKCENI